MKKNLVGGGISIILIIPNNHNNNYLGNITVFDLCGIIKMFSLDPLGSQTAARDGWSTTECFELCVHNLSIIINLSLKNNSNQTCLSFRDQPQSVVSWHPRRQGLQPNQFQRWFSLDPSFQHYAGSRSGQSPVMTHFIKIKLQNKIWSNYNYYLLVIQSYWDTPGHGAQSEGLSE